MKTRSTFPLAVFVICVAGVTPTAKAQEYSYETQALSGDIAPGTSSGVVTIRYSELLNPTINDSGQIAFSAFLTGPGIHRGNESGVWVGRDNSFALVVREGNPMPGAESGELLNNFSHAQLNDLGEIAFSGQLIVPVSDFRGWGIWSSSQLSLSLVTREGTQAPGTPSGSTFELLETPLFSNVGHTQFQGILSGTSVNESNDWGIWSEQNGAIHLIAREGDQAPGTLNGVVFTNVLFDDNPHDLSNTGHSVFSSFLTGPGVNLSNDVGIWSDRNGGDLQLVVRAGDTAPGDSTGAVFDYFEYQAINDVGDIAFVGHLIGAGVDTSNSAGIWSDANGEMTNIARAGDIAPGSQNGEVFSNFHYLGPALNNLGNTAFIGYLSGPTVSPSSNSGIWIETDGELSLVVREGEQIPGGPDGVVFGSFVVDFLGDPTPEINDLGQVVFYANLTGTGVDPTNDRSIWAMDANGELILLARTGDVFDADSSSEVEDLRVISEVNIALGSNGRSSLNSSGEVAFQLEFTDGTQGVFVAMIPEPSSAAVLALSSLFCFRRYRRTC